ncbi:MAG: hypothetical protein IJB49_04870 [Clostridia bacterium]|nr:hypothetical protein [Clostridia bacterium]
MAYTRKRFLIFFIITSLLFVFLSGCSTESTESSAQSDISSSEADDSDVQATTLTTDKSSYSINDTIAFTVTAPRETDYITFGLGCIVQYFNEDANEWQNCDKDFLIQEVLQEAYGKGTDSFVLSERADAGYEKYRLMLDVRVNSVALTLYSNEFTIE